MKKSESIFIPAQESGWFILLFDLYTRNLFRRRFNKIWIDQNYHPEPDSKTIFYLNHTSWWDGLIPFLLNRKLFRQNGRAMMEEKQMRKYTFFRKIGAFSINPENTHSAVGSLRYAVESMKRPNSSLYIYPQGEIVPFSTEKPSFKNGIGWIVNQCPDADVVPIGVYMHSAGSDKPELFLKIGNALEINPTGDIEKLNYLFEIKLWGLLKKLQESAHHSRRCFKEL